VHRKGIVIRAFAESADFLGGTQFIRTLDEYKRIFARARAARFGAVQLYLEIRDGILNLSTPDPVLRSIQESARQEGIAFPTLEIAPLQYTFTSDSPSERARGIDTVKRGLDIAATLGCPGVLVIPGYVGKMWDPKTDQVDYEAAWERTLDALRQLAPCAAERRQMILVEPVWNMFLLSPLELRGLIDETASQWCGVLLDTGNVTLFGFAEQWMRILGQRVKEIHLKDFRRQAGNLNGFVPLLAGDVNWPALRDEARGCGFSGFWIAEQFPYATHSDAVLEMTSLAMDRILGLDEGGGREGL
jgi:L-ribulose-5-phosphate 3-epimerase